VFLGEFIEDGFSSVGWILFEIRYILFLVIVSVFLGEFIEDGFSSVGWILFEIRYILSPRTPR
jgi:hypothetical protein